MQHTVTEYVFALAMLLAKANNVLATVSCPVGQYSAYGVCEGCSMGLYLDIRLHEGVYYDGYLRYDINPLPQLSPASLANCKQCPTGSYSDNANVVSFWEWTESAPGVYTAEDMAAPCKSCPAGTWSAGVFQISASTCKTCPIGFFARERSAACTQCPAGYVMPDVGSDSCTICPAPDNVSSMGTFSSFDRSECLDCPNGYWRYQSGEGECETCPYGKVNLITRAKCTTFENVSCTAAGEMCQLCAGGKYRDVYNMTCMDCPVGRHSVSNRTACETCSPGKFAETPGSDQCSACQAGEYLFNSSCIKCEPGKYQDEQDMTVCKSCARGSTSRTDGATECEQSEPGHFVASPGNIVECTEGHYQNRFGSVTCKTCPRGYVMPDTGSTVCRICPRGFFARNTGLVVCEACGAGRFQSVKGHDSCNECPPRKWTPRTGQYECEQCQRNHVVRNHQTECVHKDVAELKSSADAQALVTDSISQQSTPTGATSTGLLQATNMGRLQSYQSNTPSPTPSTSPSTSQTYAPSPTPVNTDESARCQCPTGHPDTWDMATVNQQVLCVLINEHIDCTVKYGVSICSACLLEDKASCTPYTYSDREGECFAQEGSVTTRPHVTRIAAFFKETYSESVNALISKIRAQLTAKTAESQTAESQTAESTIDAFMTNIYTQDTFDQLNFEYETADVSRVVDMSGKFKDMWRFNGVAGQPTFIGHWDVSNVVNMESMFMYAIRFAQHVLPVWDIHPNLNEHMMFENATAQRLIMIDTIKQEDFRQKIDDCLAVEPSGTCVEDWDVRYLTDMSDAFSDRPDFAADLSKWNVVRVKNMANMFKNAPKFRGREAPTTQLEFWSIDTNSISSWDISRVTNMANMFQGATIFDADIRAWHSDTKVQEEDGWSARFDCNSNFKCHYNLNTAVFQDVITFMDVIYMYINATNPAFGTISELVTSSVTDMRNAFAGHAFNGDLSAWDTSAVTDMSGMFADSTFNRDLSAWDTSAVTDMANMFARTSAFNGDLSGWDTSAVTDMTNMFADSTFNRGLSAWDTSAVTVMSGMFARTSAFNGDLSGWDTSAVTDMSEMFVGAEKFNRPFPLSVPALTNARRMFANAHEFNSAVQLPPAAIKWDIIRGANKMSARIIGGSGQFGILPEVYKSKFVMGNQISLKFVHHTAGFCEIGALQENIETYMSCARRCFDLNSASTHFGMARLQSNQPAHCFCCAGDQTINIKSGYMDGEVFYIHKTYLQNTMSIPDVHTHMVWKSSWKPVDATLLSKTYMCKARRSSLHYKKMPRTDDHIHGYNFIGERDEQRHGGDRHFPVHIVDNSTACMERCLAFEPETKYFAYHDGKLVNIQDWQSAWHIVPPTGGCVCCACTGASCPLYEIQHLYPTPTKIVGVNYYGVRNNGVYDGSDLGEYSNPMLGFDMYRVKKG